jgi:hypothetical protein
LTNRTKQKRAQIERLKKREKLKIRIADIDANDVNNIREVKDEKEIIFLIRT